VIIFTLKKRGQNRIIATGICTSLAGNIEGFHFEYNEGYKFVMYNVGEFGWISKFRRNISLDSYALKASEMRALTLRIVS
jgi:hypothetical protein